MRLSLTMALTLGVPGSALACSAALKRGETTDQFRARHLQDARVVVGTLLVTSAPAHPAETTDRIEGPVTSAIVTSETGKSYSVTFVPPGPWLFNGTVCGIF